MVGALCCLFCYSKEKEDAPTGATFNKTFVTGYLTPESIVISKMNSGIKITFKGDLITSGRSFDALSIYYNDLSYNRYTIDGPRTAINDSIYKIEVYTVENFDASHPAGSDISDLIECRYICIGSLRGPPTYDDKKRIGFFLTAENWTLSRMVRNQVDALAVFQRGHIPSSYCLGRPIPHPWI